MPLEPRASWFSPKCVEAQQLTGHLGVKHCFGAGRESGTKSRQTLNTINSIRHSPSIFIVQLFDNMKKPKALPPLSIYPRDGRAEAFGVPSSKNWGLTITSQYAFLSCLSSFMVRYSGVLGVEEPHQSIPNLVVKLYCGDDTVGEVLRKNSSTPG